MRRILFLTLLSFAVGAVTFVAVRDRQTQAKVAAHTPFTAFIQENYYDRTGKLVKSYNTLYAVRSDGSWVRIRPALLVPEARGRTSKEIWDFTAKKRIAVGDLIEAVTTWPLSESVVAAFRDPDTSCSAEPNAQRGKLLGYEVVRVVPDLPGPPGRMDRVEEWLAPALNCFRLRESFTTGPVAGPVVPATEREVLYVIAGEPSPTLFEVPAGYRELTPSEVATEHARILGKKVLSDEQLRLRDEIYYHHRKNH